MLCEYLDMDPATELGNLWTAAGIAVHRPFEKDTWMELIDVEVDLQSFSSVIIATRGIGAQA